MKCFVDSNVFISLIQNEFGKKFEFMSYRTNEFFERVIGCFHNIVISETIIEEVCRITYISVSKFMEEIKIFGKKISIAYTENKDIAEANIINKKYKIGIADALNYVVARDAGCDCIVTWNKKHFIFAEEELEVVNPSEL